MFNISEVGAQRRTLSGALTASFGIYLPGITPTDDYRVVIHADDRCNQNVLTRDFSLTCQAGHLARKS